MAKKKFKKYEYEDIRTEYLPFDSTHVAPATVIPSRTIVEFAAGTNVLKVSETPISNENKNSTVFMLAEDAVPATTKPHQYGIVYFVIENVENLEEDAE